MKRPLEHSFGRGRGGFTLLEVLAALAILGGAAFVLLNTHFTALRLEEVMTDEVTLRQLTEIAVAQAEVGVLSGMLSNGGDFGERYPDYSWSYDAVQAGLDEMILLYSVNATVQGPDEQRTLMFFMYDTGLGDQTEKQGQDASKRTPSAAGGSARDTAQTGGSRAGSDRRRGGSGLGNDSSSSRRSRGSGRAGRSSMFGN
jgi:prepilin-type N-terminal cleavage/methylation domain-containing protein